MYQQIAIELRHHVPFTAIGAITGVVLMLFVVLSGALEPVASAAPVVFFTLHPLHVVFSAAATTAMFRRHSRGRLWSAIIVGFFGSIAIATLSDSVIPFLGESLIGLPHAEPHIGFIEQWWLVNPAALLGIAIGLWKPLPEFPHAGHVFLSTWASLFHVVMALGATVAWPQYFAISAFLFLAVWLPVCLSDIVFPLLFVGNRKPNAT